MGLFSERMGYKPVRNTLQTDSMDENLRKGLWNALTLTVLTHVKKYSSEWKPLFMCIWLSILNEPLDTLTDNWRSALHVIRTHFFKCEWYEVYDFIEFMANYLQEDYKYNAYTKMCNATLEKEKSGYRFINGELIPITSEHEIDAVEAAISHPLSSVQEHLRRSLVSLSDRNNPDYRNATEEAILAAEAACKLVAKNDKTTLGDALKRLGDQGVELHPALKGAMSKLYGYASDEPGIRHALASYSDTFSVSFEEAKFILVWCSAFVNYLVGKAQSAGIKL